MSFRFVLKPFTKCVFTLIYKQQKITSFSEINIRLTVFLKSWENSANV